MILKIKISTGKVKTKNALQSISLTFSKVIYTKWIIDLSSSLSAKGIPTVLFSM